MTLFFETRYKKYGDIISFKSTDGAVQSAKRLLYEFNSAQGYAKRIRVKRVTLMAANQAFAAAQSTTGRESAELRDIGLIYLKTSKLMRF